MTRLLGLALLLTAAIVFGAACSGDDDDGGDGGSPTPTLAPGQRTPGGTAVPEISRSLRAALPTDEQVEEAFGMTVDSHSEGGILGLVDHSVVGDDAVDAQINAGMVASSWTTYNMRADYEPAPLEPGQIIVSIALYDDATAAAAGAQLGPEMLRSPQLFEGCTGTPPFELTEAEGIWAAGCEPGPKVGAALVRNDRFVIFVVVVYGSEDYGQVLTTAAQRLAQGLDLSAIPD